MVGTIGQNSRENLVCEEPFKNACELIVNISRFVG